MSSFSDKLDSIEQGTSPTVPDLKPLSFKDKLDSIEAKQSSSTQKPKEPARMLSTVEALSKPVGEPDSALAVGVKSFAESAVKTGVTLPGMIAGAKTGGAIGASVGAFGGPGVEAAFGVGGAVIGGIGVALGLGEVYDKAKEKLADLVPEQLAVLTGMDKQRREAGKKAHPDAARRGELGGGIVAFTPGSLAPIMLKGGKTIGTAVQRGAMAVLGGGSEAASELMSDKKVNLQNIAEATVWSATAAKATKLTDRLGGVFTKEHKIVDPGHEGWTTEDKKWTPPSEVNGIPVKVGEVKNKDGSKAVRDDGSSVAARHHKDEQGNSTHIELDVEQIHKEFKDKPWTKPKMEGVHALPEDSFRSPDELAYFYLMHEAEHTKESFSQFKDNQQPKPVDDVRAQQLKKALEDGHITEREYKLNLWKDLDNKELKAEYENLMNTRAMEHVQANPLYNAPDSMVPKIPTTAKEISDVLHTLSKSPEHDRSIADTFWKSFSQVVGKDNLLPIQEKFRKYSEGHDVSLTESEKNYFDYYLKDVITEKDRLTDYLKKEKVDPAFTSTDEFASRMMLPLSRETEQMLIQKGVIQRPTKKERILKTLGAVTEGSQGGFDANVERQKGAMKDRAIFVHELPNGKRTVIQFGKGEASNVIFSWENGVPKRFAEKTDSKGNTLIPKEGEYKAGQKLGKGVIKEATVEEIEANSPYRYNKNFVAVQYHKLIEMREMVRAYEFIKQWKASPAFEGKPIEVGKTLPTDHTIPRYTERLPALSGYSFPRRMSQVIEDYAQVRDPTVFTALSSFLIKNMMLNPIAHMFNEAWHLFTSRGVSGWVNPRRFGEFESTMKESWSSVMNQDAFFLEVQKKGGSLLSPGVRNNSIADVIMNKAAREWSGSTGARKVLENTGLSVVKLYNGISKASSTAMWIIRDAMYLQLIKEKMQFQKMSMEAAIADTERHMPSYRMPDELATISKISPDISRKLSRVLQNPNLSIFVRYHHGVASSLINVAVEAAGNGPKGKAGIAHGVDQVAAIGIGMAVLYPLADAIVQTMTGNPHAEQRRAGGAHLLSAIAAVVKGEKEPQVALQAVFTMNPALLAMVELGINRKMYNWQPIYHITDDKGQITKDFTNYLLTRIPSVNTYERSSSDTGGGTKQWAEQSLMDIKSPTPKRVKLTEAYRKKEEKSTKERARKRRVRAMRGLD